MNPTRDGCNESGRTAIIIFSITLAYFARDIFLFNFTHLDT